MNTLKIKISWPDEALWINRNRGRVWGAMKDAKEEALNEGCKATLQALDGEPKPDWKRERLAVEISAHKTNKAAYDLDNLAGALKAHIDGICAVLGVNDNQIDMLTVLRDVPAKVGYVEIEVRVM